MTTESYGLTFGRSWATAIAALTSNPRFVATASVTRDGSLTRPQLLVGDIRTTEDNTGDAYRPLESWLALAMPRMGESIDPLDWIARLRPWRSQLLAILLVGLGERGQEWRGWTYEREQLKPISGFQVRGPGMLT